MRIGHGAPAGTQRLGVDRARQTLRRGARLHLDLLALIVARKRRHEMPIGGEIGSRTQMHLVDGLAGLVEELQAAADLVAVTLFHREPVRPSLRKYPEIDLAAEDERGARTRPHILVDADLLVDSAVVAGQRHHLADRLEASQQPVDVGHDAGDPFAAMGGDELGFRDAEPG